MNTGCGKIKNKRRPFNKSHLKKFGFVLVVHEGGEHGRGSSRVLTSRT